MSRGMSISRAMSRAGIGARVVQGRGRGLGLGFSVMVYCLVLEFSFSVRV